MSDLAGLLPGIFRRSLFIFLLLGVLPTVTRAQTSGSAYYARENTLGVLGAYSWDSSHMLLGYAERRRLVNVGISYSRKLLLTPVGDWQYDGELLPVALESDPLTQSVNHQTSPTTATYVAAGEQPMVLCSPRVVDYSYQFNNITYTGTDTFTCSGRQWTMGEAFSPIGMRWSFLPRRRLQPFLDGHGGYMFSTRPIPISDSGSFNFTFDFGAGLELYRSKATSIRAEYRYRHISNHATATENPGIDSGLLQVTYCFRLGRR